MARRQRAAFASAVARAGHRALPAAGRRRSRSSSPVHRSPLAAPAPRTSSCRTPVAQAYEQVRAAVLRRDGLPDGDERDHQLHQARKRAKRARYAAEAVAPAFGKRASGFAAAMEELQEILGERHDSVVLQQRLHELASGRDARRRVHLRPAACSRERAPGRGGRLDRSRVEGRRQEVPARLARLSGVVHLPSTSRRPAATRSGVTDRRDGATDGRAPHDRHPS